MSLSFDYDYLFKIILIGDSGIGKSCLLNRFVDNTYEPNNISTIGVDFKMKTVQIGTRNIKLQIWDTAGQERFRTVVSSYYRGSHGVLLCFDLHDPESFENLKTWLAEINRYCRPEVPIFLIGTKGDLEQRVKQDDIDRLCSTYHYKFIRTSSKQSFNCDQTFYHMAQTLLKFMQNMELGKNQDLEGSFKLSKGKTISPQTTTSYLPCC